ncbi:MAG: glycosyltransferase family 2 protein, partial [Lachnospiraceae bacterium]|nr:glycosyltransferase family 2 protein [Lachnospiraceae bacterium]
MIRLTVFTPTYNRAHLLPRAYEAMKRQTNKNFIWMIIDDGSTDNTGEMVKSWMEQEKDFQIEYYYQENGGKYTAYNAAIARIWTELSVCIDSDDYMPDDAVEKILTFWEENGSDQYAGIVGLDYYADGSGIVGGDPLPDLKSVNLIDLLIGKYPIHNGDRTDVVRTELYKKYAPMKVFAGEKYFETHYLHLQISLSYDFLVMNENLRFVEYQPDGLSNSVFKIYRNSPNSFIETRKLYLSFPDTSFKFKFRHSAHLVSSCILAGKFTKVLQESPCPGITFLAI